MENSQIIELVKKVSEERNELAFSEIFDFIAPKINAYYIKNNLSIEQAEELTQEVMSTIWLKAELFDPEKSKNPFAYFTQIIYYAFLRRIQKEKKQLYIKHKAIENFQAFDEFVDPIDGSRIMADPHSYEPTEYMKEFVKNFEQKEQKDKKPKTEVPPRGVENFYKEK